MTLTLAVALPGDAVPADEVAVLVDGPAAVDEVAAA